MPTITASPRAVIEQYYSKFFWVEDFQVALVSGFYAEVTLFLSPKRPAGWMDILDRECNVVFNLTRYRTIFACFDETGDSDLLK